MDFLTEMEKTCSLFLSLSLSLSVFDWFKMSIEGVHFALPSSTGGSPVTRALVFLTGSMTGMGPCIPQCISALLLGHCAIIHKTIRTPEWIYLKSSSKSRFLEQ